MKQPEQHLPRIVIIDSNRLFRQKIRYLLQNESRSSFTNIDVFDTSDEFISDANNHPVDLLIIDELEFNKYPSNEGEKYLHQEISPVHTIIMSTQISLNKNIEKAPFNNQVTRLLKSIEPLIFLELVENRLGIDSIKQFHHSNINLTPREAEILEELVNGLSNKEIARKLSISDSTVKVHVQNILKKINVSSRVEAAVYAVRHQLIA